MKMRHLKISSVEILLLPKGIENVGPFFGRWMITLKAVGSKLRFGGWWRGRASYP